MKERNYLILLTVATSCAVSATSLTETKARERMNSMDQEAQHLIHALLEMIEE